MAPLERKSVSRPVSAVTSVCVVHMWDALKAQQPSADGSVRGAEGDERPGRHTDLCVGAERARKDMCTTSGHEVSSRHADTRYGTCADTHLRHDKKLSRARQRVLKYRQRVLRGGARPVP